MQIDGEAAACIGMGSSLVLAIGSFFITKEKVSRLEKDVRELKKNQDKFVTFHHFDDVILPMRRTLESVQQDIKTLLKMISENHRNDDEN